MKVLATAAAAALLLTACGSPTDDMLFDGFTFSTKVGKVDRQLDEFTVEIRDVSQSLEGARRAGAYAGIQHCVRHYGSSDVVWTVGPETPLTALPISNNTMVFRGTCPSV
jgi:hypothetical protein